MSNLDSTKVQVVFTLNESNQVQQALKYYLARKTKRGALTGLSDKEESNVRNALEKVYVSTCRGT